MGCFYQRGVRFSCRGCRYCCSVEPGYVFLSVEDVDRLAKRFGMERETFLAAYCRVTEETGFFYSLLEKTDNDCIFLTEKGCGVYEDRPLQCRTYPFWKRIMKDRESWDDEARRCPGINHGAIHTKEEVDACLRALEKVTPMIKWEE
ncbi:MAG: YkgJ family cysteine cluster protein [Sphaerochaetaceae bacterium]